MSVEIQIRQANTSFTEISDPPSAIFESTIRVVSSFPTRGSTYWLSTQCIDPPRAIYVAHMCALSLPFCCDSESWLVDRSS